MDRVPRGRNVPHAAALAALLALAGTARAAPSPGEQVVPQLAHVNEVLDIAWAPDGSFVATAGRDAKVKLWTPDGRLLRTFSSPSLLPRVAIAPDGSSVLVGGMGGGAAALHLRSVTGAFLRTFESPIKPAFGVRGFAWAPDGTWVVTCVAGNAHDACRIYDVGGAALATFDIPADARDVAGVAVSADGETIVVAAARAILAWSRAGELRWRADVGSGWVTAMALAPDGETLAVAIGDAPAWQRRPGDKPRAPTLALWDRNGRRLAEVPWHDVGSISFSRDGARIVSGGAKDGFVRIADRAGRLEKALKLGATGRYSPARAALSPDGTTLLAAAETDSPAVPRIFDLDGNKVGRYAGSATQVLAVAVDPTGQLIVTTSSDGQVRLFALDGRLVRRFASGDEYPALVAVDPKGRFLVTGSDELVAFAGDGKVVARGRYSAGGGYARAVAFSPDQRILYAAGTGGAVLAIPLAPGVKGNRLKILSRGELDALAVHPGGQLLAAGTGGCELEIFETAGRVRTKIGQEGTRRIGYVNGLAFTPGGDELVVSCGTAGAQLAVYGLDGALHRSVDTGNRFLSGGMALSPSGRWIAVTVNHDVGVYDAKTLERVQLLKGHRDEVLSLAFTGDERHLVTGSSDGTVRVWSTETWQSAAIFASNDDWAVFTDDGYFDGSRRAAELLAVVDGMEAFGVDQVALRLNRPDVIYERLRIGDAKYVEHLREVHRDRMRRAGIASEGGPAVTLDAPSVRIVSQARDGDVLELEVAVEDGRADLRALQLWANGVPLRGVDGRPLSGRAARLRERVELAQGKNRIEVSASNVAGFESRRALVLADRKVESPGTLWFVGLGVSRYRDASLDLKVAHRDAQLLDEALVRAKAGYRAVKTLVLTDADATRGALARIRSFLEPAGVDDTVVMLASGHGARDPRAAATFYFVTHEADRSDLAGSTIALEELEGVLGGTKARRRLLFLDACQSGDLDPTALAAIRARAEANGLTVRATPGDEKARVAPRTYLTVRDRYLYTRLERRTGAVIFASSLGDEVSIESPALGSGVFTAAILRALSSREVDANHDGWVSIEELEPAVKSLVSQATQGLQHPTIDRENPLQELRLPLLR